MLEHPVVRHQACVEIAHEALPYIIHAMLVVPLVHFRNLLHLAQRVGEVAAVVVLPDVVQTVDSVHADGGG